MAYPTEDQINLVMDITNFRDRAIVVKSLEIKNCDVEAVMNEYFEAPDKFGTKYGEGWDESMFSSSREGDEPVAAPASAPSFVIHSTDNQVLYGSDPGGYNYASGAPSRPPSRVNNRSPISRITDLTAGGYGSNVPTSQQQEEADLQQAINESLSGAHSPLPPPTHPPPLPPPLQQESGITGIEYSNVQFGPANRQDYNPDEWSMVKLKRFETDPEPNQRTRSEGIPVFLRCRMEEGWKQHRVGGILTVLHSIPGVRNRLLRIGGEPPYGYGKDPEWWKGNPILPPEIQQNKEQSAAEGFSDTFLPPWSDELHRLVAFLDSTERSYGTADILADSRPSGVFDSGDRERDFFESYSAAVVEPDVGDEPGILQPFTILNSHYTGEVLSQFESFYDIWDAMFLADLDAGVEEARTAVITEAPEVLTFRFTDEEGFQHPIDIPETFYLDRYLESNFDKIRQIQLDLHVISAAFKHNYGFEESLTKWVSPVKDKIMDIRAVTKASIEECENCISRIRNMAFWIEHEMDDSDPDHYYLPEHKGEPTLDMAQYHAIRYYEAKIAQMEKTLSDIESTLKGQVLPEREALRKVALEAKKLFKGPSPEQGWDPTHKYTLRGVVCDVNKIFLRKREPVLMEIDGASPPAEQWIKLWAMADNDNAVMNQVVTFDTVLKEGFARKSHPILIYATEKAMNETPEPLSPALRTFVKFDNRLFKQEVTHSEQFGNSREKKRAVSTLSGNASSESKRLNRTSSNDSMATNQASIGGDSDTDMRDAHFGTDEDFNAAVKESIAMSLDGMVPRQPQQPQQQQGDLVDVSDYPVPTQPSWAAIARGQQNHVVVNGNNPFRKNSGGNANLNAKGKDSGEGSVEEPADLLTPSPSVSSPVLSSSDAVSYSHNGTDFEDSPTRGLADVTIKEELRGIDGKGQGQQPEMQERGNMPLLISRPSP